MQNFRPLQPRHTQQTNSIAKSLATATHVFVRHGAPAKVTSTAIRRTLSSLKKEQTNILQSISNVAVTLSPWTASSQHRLILIWSTFLHQGLPQPPTPPPPSLPPHWHHNSLCRFTSLNISLLTLGGVV